MCGRGGATLGVRSGLGEGRTSGRLVWISYPSCSNTPLASGIHVVTGLTLKSKHARDEASPLFIVNFRQALLKMKIIYSHLRETKTLTSTCAYLRIPMAMTIRNFISKIQFKLLSLI